MKHKDIVAYFQKTSFIVGIRDSYEVFGGIFGGKMCSLELLFIRGLMIASQTEYCIAQYNCVVQ